MNGETVKEMVTSVGYIASIIIFGLFFFFSIESLIFFLLKLVIGYISLTFIFDFFLHLVLIHYYTGISLFIPNSYLYGEITEITLLPDETIFTFNKKTDNVLGWMFSCRGYSRRSY